MKKKLLLSIFVSSSLFANIETDFFKETQKLDRELTNINNTKSKMDIINPLNFTYSNDFETKNEYYSISFSQDIFRSGGIFHSISYSNKIKHLDLKHLDLKQQNNLLDTYILVKRIQLLDLNIEKTKLNLKNKEIEYKTKNELYRNGLTDIFTVNDLVISIESLQNSLIDLEISKKDIVNTLKSMTHVKYMNVMINHLPFPNEKEFLDNNISNLDKLNIQALHKQKDLINTNYMPKISLYGSSTEYLNSNNPTYNSIGIRLSMGLHPNIYYNNEVSKLKILKSKLSLNEKIVNMKNLYNFNKEKLSLLNKKEDNLNTIIKTLDKKLESIQQDIDLGNTTQYTFDILNNTKKQYEIDKVKLKIEKDILILSLRKNMI